MNGVDFMLAAALVVFVIHGDDWLQGIIAWINARYPDTERRRWR